MHSFLSKILLLPVFSFSMVLLVEIHSESLHDFLSADISDRLIEEHSDSENKKTNQPSELKYQDDTGKTITWQTLNNVKYYKKSHPDYGRVNYPVYGRPLKELEGKTIIIEGFIIPIDRNVYALSKNVFASCFFCGQDGPESVMGIEFEDKKIGRLKVDTFVKLKGVFELNHDDPEDWMFHITSAKILEMNP